MTTQRLKKKIKESLKKAYFKGPDDLVDVSNSPVDGSVHVVIVSRKLDDLDPDKVDDFVEDIVQKQLSPEEWSRISLIVSRSPEEIKSR